MYKCDKCICIKCKKYFGNGGDCENCSMCTIAINNKEPCKVCDDFEIIAKEIKEIDYEGKG